MRVLITVGVFGVICPRAELCAQPVVPFSTASIDPGNAGDGKAIGDLDLDGKGDAIVGGLSLVWHESGAAYAKHVIRAQPIYEEYTTDLQAVDLDGDGDVDIVVGDGDGPGNILWFENPLRRAPLGLTGDPHIGSEWIVHTIGTHGETAHDIEVADLDSDGAPEVVTSGHGFTHIWKRGRAEPWLDRNVSQFAGAGVFVGDIDRDGKPDIATPRAWLRNPGEIMTGSWTRFPISQAISGDECVLADVDVDGRLDLLTCEAHNRAAFYWFQQPADPTSSSWTRRTIDTAMGSHHPESADFDHDGRPDILMGLELAEVAVYFNMGGSPTVFQKQVVATAGGHNARCGDLDGDGLPDILACDFLGHPPVRVHINELIVEQPCYANCDGSTTAPVLNANDFVCYIIRFVAAEPYANCDGSGPLTANDFVCFLTSYAAGCP